MTESEMLKYIKYARIITAAIHSRLLGWSDEKFRFFYEKTFSNLGLGFIVLCEGVPQSVSHIFLDKRLCELPRGEQRDLILLRIEKVIREEIIDVKPWNVYEDWEKAAQRIDAMLEGSPEHQPNWERAAQRIDAILREHGSSLEMLLEDERQNFRQYPPKGVIVRFTGMDEEGNFICHVPDEQPYLDPEEWARLKATDNEEKGDEEKGDIPV